MCSFASLKCHFLFKICRSRPQILYLHDLQSRLFVTLSVFSLPSSISKYSPADAIVQPGADLPATKNAVWFNGQCPVFCPRKIALPSLRPDGPRRESCRASNQRLRRHWWRMQDSLTPERGRCTKGDQLPEGELACVHSNLHLKRLLEKSWCEGSV